MKRGDFDNIKPAILSILTDSPPLSPIELLNKLTGEADLSDSEARNAIWRLIDDGEIRLGLDRKFEVAVPQR